MAVQSSTRKWVFIGGGVVAAVALVVLFQNYPPQPKDAAGTIGAAQRYHEPQITGADVKVSQDELTTWIQSDTFDRIVKDPQARRLFADAAVTALFNDAALKMHLREAGPQGVDGDAVRLKRLVGLDDARVEVTLNADAARRLSSVVDADTARALKAAIDGGDGYQNKLHLVVGPDLARKLQLIEGPDAAKFSPIEQKDNHVDSARQQLSFTADEARSLALAANLDYARKQALDVAGSDQIQNKLHLTVGRDEALQNKLHLTVGRDEARKLAEVVGADAARKLNLIEIQDSARKVSINLDGDAARTLKAALSGDGARKMEVALGPDAARKINFAIDMAEARAQNLAINADAVRVMQLAMDNAAIAAALNNADFVRAISANPGLMDGLVVRTRSDMSDNPIN